MVCPVKVPEEYAAPSHSTATSCASDPVCFRKRGMPFFPGIVTVSITIFRTTARSSEDGAHEIL